MLCFLLKKCLATIILTRLVILTVSGPQLLWIFFCNFFSLGRRPFFLTSCQQHFAKRPFRPHRLYHSSLALQSLCCADLRSKSELLFWLQSATVALFFRFILTELLPLTPPTRNNYSSLTCTLWKTQCFFSLTGLVCDTIIVALPCFSFEAEVCHGTNFPSVLQIRIFLLNCSEYCKNASLIFLHLASETKIWICPGSGADEHQGSFCVHAIKHLSLQWQFESSGVSPITTFLLLAIVIELVCSLSFSQLFPFATHPI